VLARFRKGINQHQTPVHRLHSCPAGAPRPETKTRQGIGESQRPDRCRDPRPCRFNRGSTAL